MGAIEISSAGSSDPGRGSEIARSGSNLLEIDCVVME